MTSSMDPSAFREFIPPKDLQRSKDLATSDTYQWAALRCEDPFMRNWMSQWHQKYLEPYQGLTIDGNVRPGLYHLEHAGENHGAPTADMTEAAQSLLDCATPKERQAVQYPIHAPEWRSWMNPEIYILKHGVRLEEAGASFISAVHDLMRASLSPSGYKKALGCMKVNKFLGEVVDGKKVLNENSYNFLLFGNPSMVQPWGWQLYGHHLCINTFVLGSQMTISPVFMGAEPNIIDEGPDVGLCLFGEQETFAATIMASFDGITQGKTRIYDTVYSPPIPSCRYHRADQRHLGGAFQDNRIVPYEGIRCDTLSQAEQGSLQRLIKLSLDYLPCGTLDDRMQEIMTHWNETYFCWIGEHSLGRPFYYKLHSPVVWIEFDHHSGVFLNNKEPKHFHIHTVARTPNGNDYGKELLKQFNEDQATRD